MAPIKVVTHTGADPFGPLEIAVDNCLDSQKRCSLGNVAISSQKGTAPAGFERATVASAVVCNASMRKESIWGRLRRNRPIFMRQAISALAAAALVAIAFIVSTSSDCEAQQAAVKVDDRFEISINKVIVANGAAFYTVPVSIGGSAPIEAILDTGSSGLYVLATALKTTKVSEFGKFHRGYNSGEIFEGDRALADVSFGGSKVPHSLEIGKVNDVKCSPVKPNCFAAHLTRDNYGIGGSGVPGKGFKAILGIGFEFGTGPNPFADSGFPNWIVSLSERAKGSSIVVNPDKEELVGFSSFPFVGGTPNGKSSYRSEIKGCISEARSKFNTCGAFVLDSGTGLAVIRMKNPPQFKSNPPAKFDLQIGEGSGHLDLSFEQKYTAPWTVAFLPEDKLQFSLIVAGIIPYLKFNVLYDKLGTGIGLKPKPAAKN